jgi:phage terminase Nu1 subunit (DNA packaging protein)
MSAALTCWKDIARYLGKGVRTVQRYEREAGLPVMRPGSRHQGVVYAWPAELDAWIKQQSSPRENEESKSELDRLRGEVARLTAENQLLSQKLRSRAAYYIYAGHGSNSGASTEDIWYRCATALVVNKTTRRTYEQLTSASRALRANSPRQLSSRSIPFSQS